MKYMILSLICIYRCTCTCHVKGAWSRFAVEARRRAVEERRARGYIRIVNNSAPRHMCKMSRQLTSPAYPISGGYGTTLLSKRRRVHTIVEIRGCGGAGSGCGDHTRARGPRAVRACGRRHGHLPQTVWRRDEKLFFVCSCFAKHVIARFTIDLSTGR